MYAIAIDGPSASGKSSVANAISKKLNILHLNTGSLYRALGLYVYQNKLIQKIDPGTELPICEKAEIEKITKGADVTVKFINGKQHTFLNGDDVTDLLSTPVISDYSSRVSVIPELRQHILQIQRNIANEHNIVMEGRDITSHVLPDAKYKFFVTASPEVRAERRYNELQEKGLLSSYDEILESIKMRDFRDLHRECCPLVVVPEAIYVDTSNMTKDQVVDYILQYIKE